MLGRAALGYIPCPPQPCFSTAERILHIDRRTPSQHRPELLAADGTLVQQVIHVTRISGRLPAAQQIECHEKSRACLQKGAWHRQSSPTRHRGKPPDVPAE